MDDCELGLFGRRFIRCDDWITVAGIERGVINTVSKWFLWKVKVEESYNPPSFTVTVTLYPWAWLWLGEKHRAYQRALQALCDINKPAAVIGMVKVR